MMRHLLTVTSGYLKYTVACMLAATAAFFLAGLAITSPRTFLVVAAIAIAAALVVRMEVRSLRRAREISRQNIANPHSKSETATQILEFSKGLAAAYSPIFLFRHGQTLEAPANIESLLISQWNLSAGDESGPRVPRNDKAREDRETDIVVKYLETHREELAQIGVYPFFVSKAPSQDIIRAMRHRPSTRGWGEVVFTHHGSIAPGQTISIGFMSTTARSWPAQLETILRGPFRIVRGDVLEVTRS